MKTATAAIICGGLHLLTPWVPRVPEVVRKIKPIERKAFEPLPEDSVLRKPQLAGRRTKKTRSQRKSR